MLSTSADEGKEFKANVSEKFTSGIFTSYVFTLDSVEVFVELVVSYAFEVVSSEFTKEEMKNNSKLKLTTYHKFFL